MEHLSPDLAKWLLGGLVSAITVIVGAVATLLVKAYGLGKASAKVDQAVKEIGESKVLIEAACKKLEAIPLHDQRIGQLELVYRKMASDVRELLGKTIKLEAREEMRSGHDLSGFRPDGE